MIYLFYKEAVMKKIQAKHIGVYGIIIQDKKIVLIKKSRGGYKGKLDLPGGGMEHTESPIETLHRELQEEAGVTVYKENLFDVTATNVLWQMNEEEWEDLHHIGILYFTEIKEKTVKEEADGIDSNGASWYEIDKLKKEELSPFTIYALEKLGYTLK